MLGPKLNDKPDLWRPVAGRPSHLTVVTEDNLSFRKEGPGFHITPHAALLRDLLAYWLDKRGDRTMPARRDIDPLDIPTLLPFLYLIDVSHDPIDFSYRLLGTGIVARSRADYTGRRVRDLPPQAPPSQIWKLYEAAAVNQKPRALFVPLLTDPNSCVEKLALPLSSDGERVDILLGGISFDLVYRPYDEALTPSAN